MSFDELAIMIHVVEEVSNAVNQFKMTGTRTCGVNPADIKRILDRLLTNR